MRLETESARRQPDYLGEAIATVARVGIALSIALGDRLLRGSLIRDDTAQNVGREQRHHVTRRCVPDDAHGTPTPSRPVTPEEEQ
jgi:hypothetical protein